MKRRPFLVRLRRFLGSERFRRNPLRAIFRRIRWWLHWKFRSQAPLIVPFYGGLDIRLAHSSASYGIYLNDGFSNLAVAQLFVDFLRPGMVAFDCGAHIGEYTLLFSTLVGREGQVHAFEPDPRVHSFLAGNIARSNASNVVLNCAGLTDQEGTARYVLQEDATASSLRQFAEMNGLEEITIPTTTLDSYVKAKDLKCVDALKINVEGAATAVVAGASQVLGDLKPGLLFVECDGNQDTAFLANTLGAMGYDVQIRMNPLHWYPHLIATKV